MWGVGGEIERERGGGGGGRERGGVTVTESNIVLPLSTGDTH